MRMRIPMLTAVLMCTCVGASVAQTADKPSVVGTWTAQDAEAKARIVFAKDGTFTRSVTTAECTKTDRGKFTIAGGVILVEATGEDTIAVKFSLLTPNRLRLVIPDEGAIVMDRAAADVPVTPPTGDLPPMPVRTGGPLWPAKAGALYGFIDKAGTFVVKPQYDDAGYFSENRAYVKKGKWGYIDPTGKVVIAMKYDKAHPFSDGLACVELGSECGYVNAGGKEVIPLKYVGTGGPFSEGKAAVRDGGKWGYINRTGAWLIQPKYQQAREFSEHLATVVHEDDGKYRYVNEKDETVIEPTFTYACPFRGGRALVRIGRRGNYGYIDRTGRMVLEAKYADAGNFSEGLAYVKLEDKYGYIDRTGKMIIPAQFGSARDFSGGLAAAGIGPREGYIDRTGKVVIEALYWQANTFQGELAKVKFTSKTSGRVDRKGVLVFDGRKYPASQPAAAK